MTVEELKLEIEKLDESDRVQIVYYALSLDEDEFYREQEREIAEGIWRGYEDVLAGRVRPAREVMAELAEERGWK